MDKLENETWEDYAFRNNLFVIKYADKNKTVIDYIAMPIHTNVSPRSYGVYGACWRNVDFDGDDHYKMGFMDFIMSELLNLKHKYKLITLEQISYIKDEPITKEREEDINRQKWLFDQQSYWGKYVKTPVDVKNRYFELKTTISESHKKQLDELLAIVRDSSIGHLEGENKSNMYSEEYWCEREKEKEREKIQRQKERIDLYKKYLKNKDIQTQIMELEQKINKLKGEIVK